jgi:uncharacterized protein YndB with AHSA1/START domain
MTQLGSPAVPAIVLRRTYKASRERVFDAWTTPEIAERFFGPGEVVARDIKMDVREGGAYSITMDVPDGEKLRARGVYREVRRPERLSMTWSWEEDDPKDEVESLLTIEFNEQDGGTELVLTHEQLANVESAERHKEGWTAIIEQLGSVVQ